METVLAEVKALVCALYRAEEKAFAGTGMAPDLRGCLATVAGPANILWKRGGGPDRANVGEAHPGDLCIMAHLGHKFHKGAGLFDPDITLEQAVGVEPYGPDLEAEEATEDAPEPPAAAGFDTPLEAAPTGGDS